jgi:PHD/YefM family antitoxin component YafN of YafNO toxin-antitoxin module
MSTTTSEGSPFRTVTLEQADGRLGQILSRVCREKGRVEIRDGEHACVLISKEELQTLEEALEILSNTSDVKKIAQTIAAITHTVAQGPLVATAPAAPAPVPCRSGAN